MDWIQQTPTNLAIDINVKTKFGQTPFSLASEWGHKDVVEFLFNFNSRTLWRIPRALLTGRHRYGQPEGAKLIL